LPDLTGDDPAGIDPAHGGVIDIPGQFTAGDLEAAARTGDLVLATAAADAATAGHGGQVTQPLDMRGGYGARPRGVRRFRLTA
jgi:hypothetical protein